MTPRSIGPGACRCSQWYKRQPAEDLTVLKQALSCYIPCNVLSEDKPSCKWTSCFPSYPWISYVCFKILDAKSYYLDQSFWPSTFHHYCFHGWGVGFARTNVSLINLMLLTILVVPWPSLLTVPLLISSPSFSMLSRATMAGTIC